MPNVVAISSTGRKGDNIPISLRGKISFSEMGTRTNRSAPQSESPQPKNKEINELLDLEAFVFRRFSDVSVEVVESVVDTILAIFRNDALSDEQRKIEIQELIDGEVNSNEFDELRSLSSRILSTDTADDGISGLIEDLETDTVITDTSEPAVRSDNDISTFIALNDPIRFRNSIKVNPTEIDAHWLQNKLAGSNVNAKTVMEILKHEIEKESDDTPSDELKNLFELDYFAIYQLILENKELIYWYTKLAWANTGDERDEILETINSNGLSLEEVNEVDMVMEDVPQELDLRITGKPPSGIRFLSSPGHGAKLPEGSTRFTTRDYEQYNVPAVTNGSLKQEWPLVEVSTLPDFAKFAFEGLKVLNVVQSRVSSVMVESNVNVLLCAPTGAGKSNVALLALTRCLNDGFKCVCIAPLKALVQEQVATLQSRLSSYKVAELSGDQALSRAQLAELDVIVTTPEKWDVVTRKATNLELLRAIGLVVIDEIHLLHDETRGSVLENIVIRHKMQQFAPRLVGLSATLPNYQDIGEFLAVPPSGLFYFDSSYRPVPLEQVYIGVTPKSPIKQLSAINEACIEKIQEIVINQNKQALIFVQSRKETDATRSMILDRLGSDLIGVGIHHAGLSRESRQEAELQFKSGTLRVLVSTATLAWGVNLPAAAVIIKGTEFYNPKVSGWTQLSPQDILQMLGRAGRPGFDTQGLGIIITSHKFLNYFASVAMMAMPIESFLINNICDSINAEVSSRTIRSIDDCIGWIKNSFWFVRRKADPGMYGESYTVADVAHSALMWLTKHNSISYKFPNYVKPTYMGEIAAKFYISPESASIYSQQLKPWLSDIDIIRVFSRSAEFATIPVRQNESKEISQLASLMPIPIRDPINTRFAKVGVMLQAYISRLKLSGLALRSDVEYVAQSASRLFRAIFELSLAAKWGNLARRAHELYLMVDRRQWNVGQSPLRQFPQCPPEIIARMESSQIPWQRYFDLRQEDIGRVLRILDGNLANTAFSLIQKFPRFKLSSEIKPVSYNWVSINVEITSLNEINKDTDSEIYWLLVETSRGHILASRSLPLEKLKSQYYIEVPIKLEVTNENKYVSPYLFVRLLSDKWLHFYCEVPVNLRMLEPPSSTSDEIDVITESVPEAALTPLEGSSRFMQALSPLLKNRKKSLFVGMFPNCTYFECIQVILDESFASGEDVLIVSHDTQALQKAIKLHDNVEIWDVFKAEIASRKTTNFSSLSAVNCVIFEGMHNVGTSYGYYYEALVTRLKIAYQSSIRFVGFGFPVTSSLSVGQWLGAKKTDIFNFGFDTFPDLPQINVTKCSDSLITSLWGVIEDINRTSSNVIVVGSRLECLLVKEELELASFDNVMTVGSSFTSVPLGSVVVCTADQLSDTLRVENVFLLMNSFSLPVFDLIALTMYATTHVIVVTKTPEFLGSCINAPIPMESKAQEGFADMLIPEIVKGNVKSPQDAINWLMSSFLFKRIRQNPSYYGCVNIQDWLSELVESSFENLAHLKAIRIINEDSLEIEPEMLAYISVNRGVSIESLHDNSPILVPNKRSWLTNKTANLINLRGLDAKIDISLANNDLSKVFATVDQRQYLVQSLPLGASPLCQIPWIDSDVALRCQDAGISSIQDFIAIEDDVFRSKLLGFDNENEKMVDVAEFVNHFPIVDIESIQLGTDKHSISINIERDLDPDVPITVHAARGFPADASENWYLIGANDKKDILFFDRLEILDEQMHIEYEIKDASLLDNHITVWLICGSYIEADKQLTITT